MTRHQEPHFSRSTCPVDQLEWFVNRTLSAEQRGEVEAHLAQCTACQAEVAEWAELRQSMLNVGTSTPEPRADLFPLIEQRLDQLAAPAPWFRLQRVFQVCWFALNVGAELFRAQARLLRRDLFWMPLFIVPLAASIVYLPGIWQRMPGSAALLAALLTALGMAFLYGQQVDPAREIALVTQTSPRLVLGIRCCLVFGYDLLLNCGLVLPILASQGIITPAWFLTNWLAPLCCLSAIALLLSVLANASVAVFACTFLWGLRVLNSVLALALNSLQPLPEAPWQQAYEHFWHQGPLLFIIAILAVGLAFIALERKERFAQ
jgi:hypothetical protein